LEKVLEGRNALVTGASRGIGEAIATRFAEEGASVVVTARDKGRVNEVANHIEEAGNRALPIVADLLKGEDRQRLVESAIEEFGQIDILVNNAAVNQVEPSLEVTEETWDRILETNLKSVFFLTQAVAKHMLPRRSGRIINICSDAGLKGFAEHAAYGTSKAGLIHLTRILAAEWGPQGVRVNAVCPGATWTGMTAPAMEQEDLRQSILARGVVDRISEPAEVAGLVAYLARNEAEMITGQALSIDGGSTAL